MNAWWQGMPINYSKKHLGVQTLVLNLSTHNTYICDGDQRFYNLAVNICRRPYLGHPLKHASVRQYISSVSKTPP